MRIEKVISLPDLLGESPVWDAASQRLMWIDGRKCLVRAFFPATGLVRTWDVHTAVGSIALIDSARILIAGGSQFNIFNLETESSEQIAELPDLDASVRLNDGRADRCGRFVCGGMSATGKPLASVYGLKGNTLTPLFGGVRIANGTCFNPSGDTMYFADSLSKKILAYPYDGAKGTIGSPELLFDTSTIAAIPDGATVDAAGNVWVAVPNKAQVACISDRGKLLRSIDMPIEFPSSVAFGGPDLDILFVTSIRDSGTGRTVSTHPDGGCLHAIYGLDAIGLPEPSFRA